MGDRIEWCKEFWADVFGLVAVAAVFEKFIELWVFGTARIWEDILWIRAFETVLFGAATLLSIERLIKDLKDYKDGKT